MKDLKVVAKNMTRNSRKMTRNTVDSLLCPLHSIQFSPLAFLSLCSVVGRPAYAFIYLAQYVVYLSAQRVEIIFEE